MEEVTNGFNINITFLCHFVMPFQIYSPPSGPLPVPPIGEEHSSEDELEDEKEVNSIEDAVPDKSDLTVTQNK